MDIPVETAIAAARPAASPILIIVRDRRQLDAAAGQVDQNGEQKEYDDFIEEFETHGPSSQGSSGYHHPFWQ